MKKILIFFGLLLSVCFLLVAFLPSILSTRSGKELLIKMIHKKTDHELSIYSLSLSWFGAQDIQKITLKNKNKETVFNCESMVASGSLWQLLIMQKNIGKLIIEKPEIILLPSKLNKTDVSIRKEIAKSSDFSSKKLLNPSSFSLVLPFCGEIVINQALVELQDPVLSPIVFEKTSLALEISQARSHLKFSLNGNTKQDGIKGEFAVRGTVEELTKNYPEFDIEAKIKALPTKGIDLILSFFNPNHLSILSDLVGSSIDLNLKGVRSLKEFGVHFNASSDRFSATFQTKKENATFSLESPSYIRFLVTPDLVRSFMPSSLLNLSLQNNVNLDISIDHFSLPMVQDQIDLPHLSVQGSLSLSSAKFALPSQETPLILDKLRAQFQSDKLQEKIIASASSSFQYGKQPFDFSVGFSLLEPLFQTRKIEIETKTQKFPTLLIEELNGNKPSLSSFLGPYFDLKLKGNILLSTLKKNQFFLEASSSSLNIPETVFTLDDQFKLLSPVTISYFPSKNTFLEQGITLENISPVLVNLVAFQFPLESNFHSIRLKLMISVDSLTFKKLPSLQTIDLNHLICDLNIETLNQVNLEVKEDRLKANLCAELNEKNLSLKLKKPLLIDYSFTNESLHHLMTDLPPYLQIAQPTTLHLILEPLTFLLAQNQLETQVIQVRTQIDPLSLKNEEKNLDVRLQNLEVLGNIDIQNHLTTLQLENKADKSNQAKGSFKAVLQIDTNPITDPLDFSGLSLSCLFECSELPSSLLDIWFNKNFNLSSLFGSSIQSSIKLSSTPLEQKISIDLKSPLLTIRGDLEKNKNKIFLKKPMEASFLLTSETYETLNQILNRQVLSNNPFEIDQNGIFSLSLTKFQLPTVELGPSHNFFSRIPQVDPKWFLGQIEGNMLIDQLSFREKTSKEEVALHDIFVEFKKDENNTPFYFNFKSDAFSKGQVVSGEGKIDFSAQIDQFISSQNELDIDHASLEVNLEVLHFPVAACDLLSKTFGNNQPFISAIFGDVINAKVVANIQNLNGPLLVDINSINTQAHLNGSLQNGSLKLLDPFSMQMLLDEKLGAFLIQEVNPLSLSSLSAKNPVSIQIEPEEFSLPLFHFDAKNLSLSKGKIELGKILTHNEGNLNVALGLLKYGQLSKNNELNLWFAPIEFHIDKGVIHCERTEVLIADTFDIAIWGNIDLPKDYLNMVFGLTAECLKKAFGIKNLPKDYILQIPLKGKMNKVEVNKTKATAKIAALLAWQQKSLGNVIGGNGVGALFNEFLNVLPILPDQNSKSPPAKHPFPWEVSSEFEVQNKKTSSKKKKQIKNGDKPLKQLLKILG